MKAFFTWLAGGTGRIVRSAFGIALIILGYILGWTLAGVALMVVGAVLAIAAGANVCLPAVLFGYPFSGNKLLASSAPDGEDHLTTEQQSRPLYHAGSTTGGGSNFGQGSLQLGVESYKQGSEQNRGANYENEPGFLDGEDAIE